MKKTNNKSGFTLIEIIVVLIIIGVLASIALPNLFSNIPRAKAATALASADAYKTVLESCFGTNAATPPGTSPCTLAAQNLTPTIQNINMVLAGSGSAGAGNLAYTLVGTDANGTGAIAWTISRSTNGAFTCSPSNTPGSPYENVC
jgi:type IV pilus assembly protein PilA